MAKKVADTLDFDLAALKGARGQWVRSKLDRFAVRNARFFVRDLRSAQNLADVQRILDTELDSLGSKALSCMNWKPEPLKAMLRLGLDPDTRGTGDALSIVLTRDGCVDLAEVLSVCRPSLSSKDVDGGRNPEELAAYACKKVADEMGRMTAQQKQFIELREIWRGLARTGFPSIARLAYAQKWWAVQNLARRHVVSGREAIEKYLGKTVVGWAKFYGQEGLAGELRFLLQIEEEEDQLQTRQNKPGSVSYRASAAPVSSRRKSAKSKEDTLSYFATSGRPKPTPTRKQSAKTTSLGAWTPAQWRAALLQ